MSIEELKCKPDLGIWSSNNSNNKATEEVLILEQSPVKNHINVQPSKGETKITSARTESSPFLCIYRHKFG